jgi:hypothetical protein
MRNFRLITIHCVTQSLRISGLVAACDQIHARISRLAQTPSTQPAEMREQLTQRVRTLVAQVDGLCAGNSNNPANLPTPSRRAYQWLRFLVDEDSLTDHVTTVRLAYEVIRQNPKFKEQAALGYTVQFELGHSGHLWRTQAARKWVSLSAAEGFCGAPREVLEAIALAATSHSAKAKDIVRAYAASDDFTEIVTALELTIEQEEGAARGRQYDLDAVFARVNCNHFANAMPRPRRLIWSSRITSRIMGYYQTQSDTVMLSRTLDDVSVPERVVDLVMYHELLHKQLGVRISNGRRQAHFAEFRHAERRFPNFDRVNTELEAIARRAWNQA